MKEQSMLISFESPPRGVRRVGLHLNGPLFFFPRREMDMQGDVHHKSITELIVLSKIQSKITFSDKTWEPINTQTRPYIELYDDMCQELPTNC